MKIFYCDLETTGVDRNQNGIIQISGMIEINGVEKDRFNLLVKPFKGQIVTAEALKVTGRTLDELRSDNFRDPRDVYKDLAARITNHVDKYDKTDKFHFVAYNAPFDMDFLREFFERNGDNYFGSFFYFPDLDIMRLAAFYFAKKRHTLNNFKLATVAEALGIPVDEEKTHDGLYDIELARKIAANVDLYQIFDEGIDKSSPSAPQPSELPQSSLIIDPKVGF